MSEKISPVDTIRRTNEIDDLLDPKARVAGDQAEREEVTSIVALLLSLERRFKRLGIPYNQRAPFVKTAQSLITALPADGSRVHVAERDVPGSVVDEALDEITDAGADVPEDGPIGALPPPKNERN